MVDTTEVLAARDLWIFNFSLSGWIFCGGDAEKIPKLIKQTSNIIKLCLARHREEQPDLSTAQRKRKRTALLQTLPCSAVSDRLSGCLLMATLTKWVNWAFFRELPTSDKYSGGIRFLQHVVVYSVRVESGPHYKITFITTVVLTAWGKTRDWKTMRWNCLMVIPVGQGKSDKGKFSFLLTCSHADTSIHSPQPMHFN